MLQLRPGFMGMQKVGIQCDYLNQIEQGPVTDRALFYFREESDGPRLREGPRVPRSGVWGSTGGTPRNAKKLSRPLSQY